MKIYRLPLWKDLILYATVLIFSSLDICIIYKAIIDNDPSYRIPLLTFVPFSSVLSITSLRSFYHWRLIITEKEIIEKSLFKEKRIALSEIKGYNIDEDYLNIESNMKGLTLHIGIGSFCGYKEFEHFIQSNFKKTGPAYY